MNKKMIILVLILFVFALVITNTRTEAEDTFIDPEYVAICEEVGEEYNISPELLEAIIETESAGEQYADNGPCKGLCQIYYAVHMERMHKLGLSDIYDPRTNITLAADILVECFETYGDDLMLVLMKYNGVSHAIERAQAGYFSSYAEKVSARAQELEALHGKTNYASYTSDLEILKRRARDD